HKVALVWQNGRLALLADAAHPTLPIHAPRACLPLAPPWTQAACLDPGPDAALPMAQYPGIRHPRCTRIVAASAAKARNYHLDGVRRIVGHGVLRDRGRAAPALLPSRLDWLYDHDPTATTP
ncbi:MAG: monooxygenase, partial [Paracoccus sp. (in: a-proteobacteria)]|nr:monooxygenase [Paracoccus sp. (in: a-proteobacteria)]